VAGPAQFIGERTALNISSYFKPAHQHREKREGNFLVFLPKRTVGAAGTFRKEKTNAAQKGESRLRVRRFVRLEEGKKRHGKDSREQSAFPPLLKKIEFKKASRGSMTLKKKEGGERD